MGAQRDATHEQLVAGMLLHNDFVRCLVRPERLLEFDIFVDGTEGLMHRLGVFIGLRNPPPPTAAYPRMTCFELVRIYEQHPELYAKPHWREVAESERRS